MSKTKKFISIILAIIVLVGVGFGAYLLIGKKDNKLTEQSAIKLVDKTSDKLDEAITTIGNGFASNSASQSVNASANLLASSSSRPNEYVEFLNMITFANSYLDMVNYTLKLTGDDTISFDKTYAGYAGESQFFTIYRDNDLVVFEFGINDEDVDDDGVVNKKLYNTYGIIDYDSKNNAPSMFTFIIVNEGSTTEGSTTDCSLELRLYSIDFNQKLFNCYEVYMYNITRASTVTSLRDNLSKGALTYDDIKTYVDFESGEDFFVYTGNIADNINDINIASHRSSNVKNLFNSYSSNVKHLDYCAKNKSKLDYKKYENFNKVNNDMLDVMRASQRKYNYFVSNNDFYFIAVDDYKLFDRVIINSLKTTISDLETSDFTANNYTNQGTSITLTADDTSNCLEMIQNGINKLSDYYEQNKSSDNYISIMLGKCASSFNLSAAIKATEAEIYSSSEPTNFIYSITFEPLTIDNCSARITYSLGDGQ